MAKAPAAPETTRVRILTDQQVDGTLYRCDQVADLDAAMLAAAVEQGWADPHPDAVAYAESLVA